MSDFHQNHTEFEQIKLFVEGKMNPSERDSFQQSMDADPFLKDAVEGFKQVKGSISTVDTLKQKGFSSSLSKFVWISSLAGIIAFALVFFNISEEKSSVKEVKNNNPKVVLEPEVIAEIEDSTKTFHVLHSKETDSSVHIAVAGFDKNKIKQKENFVSIKSVEKKELDDIKSIEFDPIEVNPGEAEIAELYDYYFIEDYKLYNYLVGRDNEIESLKPVLNGVPASKESGDSQDPLADFIYEKVSYPNYLRKAVVVLSEEKYQKAYKMFDKILEVYPDDVNASFYLAYCSFRLKNFKRAQKEFQASVDNKNRLFKEESMFHLALSAYENKELGYAKELLQKIVKSEEFYSEQAKDFLKNQF